MLCVALALIFSGVALSQALDRLQHAPGAAKAHAHLIFSEYSEADHDRRHGSDDGAGDGDSTAGHHHHHFDSGTGLIATPAALPMSAPVAMRLLPPADFSHAGETTDRLDRPPRTFPLSA